MFSTIKHWWAKRQLDKAQATIEGYGLRVVKFITIANTTYLVDADGTHHKLVRGKK